MKKPVPKKSNSKAFAKKVMAALEHTNDDVKRYIGVVSEHFGDQVSAVAEQFLGMNEKVDSLTEMVGDMKEDFEIIKTDLEILKSGI